MQTVILEEACTYYNVQTSIRMSVGLFTTEIYANWVRKEELESLEKVEKKAMRFRCKLISIDPLLRYKAKIELSLAILISV